MAQTKEIDKNDPLSNKDHSSEIGSYQFVSSHKMLLYQFEISSCPFLLAL
ncbi:hypothetical protein [Gracilibacillus boraciitolerans]|nr:hypothetical protein [Gracilibacillus boraciitolerans]